MAHAPATITVEVVGGYILAVVVGVFLALLTSWFRWFALAAKRVAQADFVITTALIPGRAAPVLVTQGVVKAMRPGSVIVDLAAPQGGNCPLTEPGQTVLKHCVTLGGETNLPVLVAADASAIGPGKADVLQGIAEMGSIAETGRRLGMSYQRCGRW